MRLRPLVTLALLVASGFVSAEHDGRSGVPTDIPGRTLPVTRQHTYRMAGKIRVLLLWVGRDDVGSGVIKWRGAGDDRAIELLIGSDPTRAPAR